MADMAADSAANTAEASVDRATDRHRVATEDTHRSRDMVDTKVLFLELERLFIVLLRRSRWGAGAPVTKRFW